MNLEFILRLILISFGIVFLVLSFAGAILALARRADDLESTSVNPLAGITELLGALKALIDALAAAPLWLGLGGFGVLLILLGALLPMDFLTR